MKTITFAEHVTIPESVQNLESFRQWVTADDFSGNLAATGEGFGPGGIGRGVVKDLAQAAATPNQAITILEKFRIHPQAAG